jgi:hypothetical protein
MWQKQFGENFTLMESEGSEPDMAACLAAARLSTSSAILHIKMHKRHR